MAFVSNDKLHKRVVPLLLGEDQIFIDGEELKDDLRMLDVHYSALPPEHLEQGLFHFADPPDDDRFLTTRIYRKFGLRVGENISLAPAENKKVSASVLALVDALKAGAKDPASGISRQEFESAQSVSIERRISPQRGKWRVMSREAEAAPQKNN